MGIMVYSLLWVMQDYTINRRYRFKLSTFQAPEDVDSLDHFSARFPGLAICISENPCFVFMVVA